MSRIVATAPGKIVLAGEYAVLHGAQAIAAAVDRRAIVTLQPVAVNGIEVHAPGYQAGSVHYRQASGNKLELLDDAKGSAGLSLFEHAWNVCKPTLATGAAITLDTSQFIDPASGQKLGVGSSAALCVAMTAAFRPELDVVAVAQLAQQAHQAFQCGGSGVDIACAAFGGIIDYQMGASSPATVAAPAGLHFAILWSGHSASTSAKIQSLASSLQDPRRHATLQKLRASADVLAASWLAGQAADVFRQFQIYSETLREFDADQELGIFAGGHAALTAAASEQGLLYKPCGAGGGDIGVALALDVGALAAFVATAPQFGFASLDMAMNASGMERNGKGHDG